MPKVLDLLGQLGFRDEDIRICGDKTKLVGSCMKEGSYGYLFLSFDSIEVDREEVDQKLGYLGRILRNAKHKTCKVLDDETFRNSISLYDLKAADLEGQVVIINSGDFRRLKGVVLKEHNGEDGREVDVEIKTMTMTRIITISKEIVSPIQM